MTCPGTASWGLAISSSEQNRSVARTKVHSTSLGAAPEFLRIAGASPSMAASSRLVSSSPAVVDRLHRVSLIRAREAWVSACEIRQDPCFGLHVAECAKTGDMGILDYLLQSSRNWAEAFRRLREYSPLFLDADKLTLRTCRDTVHLIDDVRHPVPVIVDFALSIALLRTREYSGEPVRPLSVRLARPRPTDIREYERVFDAKIEFESNYSEIVLAREVLDLPFRTYDPTLSTILDEYAAYCLRRLRRHPPELLLLDDIRSALRACMAEGNGSVVHVAERMGTSARTLQRWLHQMRTSYRVLLAEVRADILSEQTGAASPSRARLAKILGYSSPSSLRRAMRNWRDGQTV